MANATHPSQVGAQAHPAAYSNVIGAAISLAVLVGIVGWGVKTLVRDSSGVPVVVALDGPMRVAPDDPGGVAASHQGLTVNQVAGSQVQPVLSDNLQLAPRPVALLDEDVPMGNLAGSRPLVRPNSFDANVEMASLVVDGQTVTNGSTTQDLAALVASVSNPTSDLTIESVVEVAAAAPAVLPQGGLTRSLRPNLRPAFAAPQAAVAAPAAVTPVQPAVAAAVSAVVEQAVIPVGSRMAQLGAYESMDVATREWARLSQRFDNYLSGRPHIIQAASSGGSTFYRLRVHGFADAGEARRLCSALIAQNAACYPVTMN